MAIVGSARVGTGTQRIPRREKQIRRRHRRRNAPAAGRARSMIRRRIREGHLFTFLEPPQNARRQYRPRTTSSSQERGHPRHAPISQGTGPGAPDQGDLLVVPPTHRTSRTRILAGGKRVHRPEIEELHRLAWERSPQGAYETFGIPNRYGTGID